MGMYPTDTCREGRFYSFVGLPAGDAPFAMRKPMTLAFASPGCRGMKGK